MDAPIRDENERILKTLKAVIADSGLTIRAVERKAGVSYTVFQKVLSGSTNLQFHHILEILKAIGMSWSAFFLLCYPPPQAEQPPQPTEKPKREVTWDALDDHIRELFKLAGLQLPARPAP